MCRSIQWHHHFSYRSISVLEKAHVKFHIPGVYGTEHCHSDPWHLHNSLKNGSLDLCHFFITCSIFLHLTDLTYVWATAMGGIYTTSYSITPVLQGLHILLTSCTINSGSVISPFYSDHLFGILIKMSCPIYPIIAQPGSCNFVLMPGFYQECSGQWHIYMTFCWIYHFSGKDRRYLSNTTNGSEHYEMQCFTG